MKMGKACVYDIVHKGEVVYVGMTSNPEARLKQHRRTGVAFAGAKLVVHKWCESRKEARWLEHDRQMDLMPVFCEDCHVQRPPVDISAEFDAIDLASLPPMTRRETVDYIVNMISEKKARAKKRAARR